MLVRILARISAEIFAVMHLSMLCRQGGGGEARHGWGFDCLCWLWGRAFDLNLGTNLAIDLGKNLVRNLGINLGKN